MVEACEMQSTAQRAVQVYGKSSILSLRVAAQMTMRTHPWCGAARAMPAAAPSALHREGACGAIMHNRIILVMKSSHTIQGHKP